MLSGRSGLHAPVLTGMQQYRSRQFDVMQCTLQYDITYSCRILQLFKGVAIAVITEPLSMKFKAQFCFCCRTIPLHDMSHVHTCQLKAAVLQIDTLPGSCAAVEPCSSCLQMCLAPPGQDQNACGTNNAGM